MPTTKTWNAALDDFGRALLHFEQQLDLDPTLTKCFAFEFPAGLGPLTPDLLDVATNLVAMTARMEDRVRLLQNDVQRQQMAITRARSQAVQERPRAHFIDVQG